MKRLLLLGLLLCASQAWAATRYVKTPCANNGDGTADSCAGAPDGVGAWNSMDNALAAWACGDTVNVGAGTYRTDKWNITTSCTAGNELIIQRTGWTAVGSVAYDAITEAVKTLTAGDWTQCAWDGAACDCDAGNLNVQIGAGGETACTETWWHTKTSDGANRVYWATKPDGSITPRRNLLSEMTAQYDANDPDGTATILVRWGSSLPADPSVNFSNNGNQWFCNGCDYVIIRGFTIRRGIRAAFYTTAGSNHVTLQDNVLKYFNDGSSGSARAVEVDSSTVTDVLDNELAYATSEPLHITTFGDGTVSGTIARNYVHGIGDATTMGNAQIGTPNCTTFTNDASSGGPTSDKADQVCTGAGAPFACCSGVGVGTCCEVDCTDAGVPRSCCSGLGTGTCTCAPDTGDNAGLIVESNIFQDCNEQDTAKGAFGIYLESTVKSAIFRNNIISGVAACIELRPFHSTPIGSGVNGINTNEFYNNICFGLLNGTHDVDGSCFNLNADGQSSPSAAINGNKFFNNTCDDNLDMCIKTGTGSGLGNTATNTFTNNICVKDSLSSPTNFIANHTTATGLAISKNVVWSGKTSGQCGVVNNATVSCGDAGCEFCADPVLVSETDNHIQTSSPAKDAGTATGMPAGRTTDISNTIAILHGLPDYNDADAIQGGVWDIGADEFVAAGASRRAMVIAMDGGTCP